jgi:hypothetical protein
VPIGRCVVPLGTLLSTTDGQCRSVIHLPITISTPTLRPHVWHGWVPHCARSSFLRRTSKVSSLSLPSHGFTGGGIAYLSSCVECSTNPPIFWTYPARWLIVASDHGKGIIRLSPLRGTLLTGRAIVSP